MHVNAVANAGVPTAPGDLDRLSEEDRKRAEENRAWWYGHSGYATQMSTRPQTLAYALNDSPAGQLAWNLEWFVDWDPTATTQTPVDRDAILTNVTIFWLTGTAGSAARLYLEAGQDGWGERPAPSGVPTAVANFRGDHAIRGLAALSNTITRWTEYDTGGHFASLQAPDVLVEDIREFFRGLFVHGAVEQGPQLLDHRVERRDVLVRPRQDDRALQGAQHEHRQRRAARRRHAELLQRLSQGALPALESLADGVAQAVARGRRVRDRRHQRAARVEAGRRELVAPLRGHRLEQPAGRRVLELGRDPRDAPGGVTPGQATASAISWSLPPGK